MKVYQALYNPMIEESAYTTLSIHLTEEGATRAIEEHKRKKWNDWNDMYENESPSHEFGKYEDWTVIPIEIKP